MADPIDAIIRGLRAYRIQRTKLARVDETHPLDRTPHPLPLLPPVPATEVERFERANGVTLPDEYRAYVLRVSGGGFGPPYGLASFLREPAATGPTGYVSHGALARPFLHRRPLMIAREMQRLGERRFREQYGALVGDGTDDGSLDLAHLGCGMALRLVVTGPERGNLWVDDRANDGGIYPEACGAERRMYAAESRKGRVGFAAWYAAWLTQGLAVASELLKSRLQ
jgi:hypothetical protein